MAVSIFLANSPPLHSFLGSYGNPLLKRVEPLRPCLSGVRLVARGPEVVPHPSWRRRKKKRVVFADARGLALTAVHVFNEAEDNLLSELQFHMTELEGATSHLHLLPSEAPARPGSQLLLDFVQPASDYLDMRNRLKTQQVCLETCSIQDRMLSGTVQVRNVSFEKSVWVRITFDSWRSHQDVPGLYLNNVYGCTDTETFSFSVLVPEVLQPSNLVEFCVQYQTRDQTFWDNNRGQNYRLVAADAKGGPAGGAGTGTGTPPGLKSPPDHSRDQGDGIQFDPFGSPRTSAGIFPEWQSWGQIEDSAPYW